MGEPNLKEIHDFLVEVAHKAGDMITNANPSSADTGSKKNSADLVTETDQAVENMVSTTLREKYPDFKFMGEETYKPGMTLTESPTFIVDPIDGTTNFVHAHPYVSISLGFAIDKIPVVGVVYNPFSRVLYSAIKGQGAHRLLPDEPGAQKLPLQKHGKELEELKSLDSALIAIEWGSDRSGSDYTPKINTFAKLCRSKEEGGAMIHGFRSFGSAALNLCQVAEGGIDMYWEGGCWAWDVCAGWVILIEAGGMIVDGNPPGGKNSNGWKPTVDQRRYLALRNGATKEVVEEFWGCVEGEMSYAA